MGIEWLTREVCRGPRIFSTLRDTIQNYGCIFGEMHIERGKLMMMEDDIEDIR